MNPTDWSVVDDEPWPEPLESRPAMTCLWMAGAALLVVALVVIGIRRFA